MQGMMLGLSVGGGIGAFLDPLAADVKGQGAPETTELNYSTSEEGLILPDLLGTSKFTGQHIWFAADSNRSVEITEEMEVSRQEGKEVSTSTETVVTGYDYYLTWAQVFGKGPLDTLYAVYNYEDCVWDGEVTRPSGELISGELFLARGYEQKELFWSGESVGFFMVSGEAYSGEDPGIGTLTYPYTKDSSDWYTTITLDNMGEMRIYFGAADQPVDDIIRYWTSGEDARHLIPAYRGQAYAVFNDNFIGGYNRVPNIYFVAAKTPVIDLPAPYRVVSKYDMNPAHVLWYILTHWAEVPEAYLNRASFVEAATTLYLENLGIGVFFDRSDTARTWLETVLSHSDGFLKWANNNELVLKLIRDDVELDDIPQITIDDMTEHLSFKRGSWMTTINELKVQYPERAVCPSGEAASGEWMFYTIPVPVYNLHRWSEWGNSPLQAYYVCHSAEWDDVGTLLISGENGLNWTTSETEPSNEWTLFSIHPLKNISLHDRIGLTKVTPTQKQRTKYSPNEWEFYNFPSYPTHFDYWNEDVKLTYVPLGLLTGYTWISSYQPPDCDGWGPPSGYLGGTEYYEREGTTYTSASSNVELCTQFSPSFSSGEDWYIYPPQGDLSAIAWDALIDKYSSDPPSYMTNEITGWFAGLEFGDYGADLFRGVMRVAKFWTNPAVEHTLDEFFYVWSPWSGEYIHPDSFCAIPDEYYLSDPQSYEYMSQLPDSSRGVTGELQFWLAELPFFSMVNTSGEHISDPFYEDWAGIPEWVQLGTRANIGIHTKWYKQYRDGRIYRFYFKDTSEIIRTCPTPFTYYYELYTWAEPNFTCHWAEHRLYHQSGETWDFRSYHGSASAFHSGEFSEYENYAISYIVDEYPTLNQKQKRTWDEPEYFLPFTGNEYYINVNYGTTPYTRTQLSTDEIFYGTERSPLLWKARWSHEGESKLYSGEYNYLEIYPKQVGYWCAYPCDDPVIYELSGEAVITGSIYSYYDPSDPYMNAGYYDNPAYNYSGEDQIYPRQWIEGYKYVYIWHDTVYESDFFPSLLTDPEGSWAGEYHHDVYGSMNGEYVDDQSGEILFGVGGYSMAMATFWRAP